MARLTMGAGPSPANGGASSFHYPLAAQWNHGAIAQPTDLAG